MESTALNETLKQVSPALSTNDIVPVFRCYCFSGGTVTAFDERVAIQAPCVGFPLEGAIDGVLLSKWVNSAAGKDITVQEASGDAVFKAGRSRLKLPIIPADEFLFKFPKLGKQPTVEFGWEDFMWALQKSKISMGIDPASPTLLGITMHFSAGRITMYSSNNITMTRVVCHCVVPEDLYGAEVIMPPRLVELLYKTRASEYSNMVVGKGYFAFTTEDGTKVYGRQARGADAEQFLDMLESIGWDESEGWAEAGVEFSEAITRATLMGEESTMALDIEKGVATLTTKSARGINRDTVALKGHPDAVAQVLPTVVLPGLEYATKLQLLGEECLATHGEGFDHIVALLGDE